MTVTTIEWTAGDDGVRGRSWNPIRGCSLASDECINCYAQDLARRFSGPGMAFEGLINAHGKWNGVMRQAPARTLVEPFSWRTPSRVFVNSMTDVFHENVPDDWLDSIFAVMAMCPQHVFIVLTKRADRMREYFAKRREQALADSPGSATTMWHVWSASIPFETPWRKLDWRWDNDGKVVGSWPLPNVILGVSVGQREFLSRIDDLRATPAAVRMVSFEPLLEDLGGIDLRDIGWAIAGGESGRQARPVHPEWVRGIRNQCTRDAVPFFFKQWGEWWPISQTPLGWIDKHPVPLARTTVLQLDGSQEFAFPLGAMTCLKVGKHIAGRDLDGRVWNEFPRYYRV